MIEWYVRSKRLRALSAKAQDAFVEYEKGGEAASATINGYMKADLQQLKDHWIGQYPKDDLIFRDLGRHIGFGMGKDYSDIVKQDVPALENAAEARLLADGKNQRIGFEDLLHPAITASSFELYRNGHLREAVLNSITALFDHIRRRTKCDEDGDRLIGRVYALDKPMLTLSDLQTESGQNDQKGFMQILKAPIRVSAIQRRTA